MPKGESFFGKFESIWNKTNPDKERGKDSLSPEEKKRIEEALGIIGQANEWSGDMEDKKRYLEAVERIISLGRKGLPFLKEKLTDSKRSTERDAFLLARFFSWIGTVDDIDLAIDAAKKDACIRSTT